MRNEEKAGRHGQRWQRWLARNFPPPYQLHPLTLQFLDSDTENDFAGGHEVDAIFLSRLALLSGLFVYSLFGVMDYYLLAGQHQAVWLVRFGIGVPTLLLAIALSFVQALRPYYDWVLLLVAQLIALTLVIMLATVQAAEGMLFVSGLMLLLVFNFVAFRMRVWVATLSGTLITLVFLLGAVVADYGGAAFLASGAVFLFATVLPLVFGATISELFARKHFVQSRLLDELANTDSLTGLPNRRAFIHRLREELSRYRRYDAPFAVAMVDADHFKRINDAHGHDAGDRVLREMGQRFQAQLRASDMVARLGGEEFALVLSQTDRDRAARVCDRIREAIVVAPICLDGDQDIELSVSVGVVTPDMGGNTVDALLKRADDAMYQAKAEGRNCVIIAA